MIRNKYKGINGITTIPIVMDGKEIGNVVLDCAYREMKFHIDVDSAEYKKFMDAFNKTGIDGFAIVVREDDHNEKIH